MSTLMMKETETHTAGTGSSAVVTYCQVCGCADLEPSLFLGYQPPVNQMRPVGQPPHEQPAYPAQLLYCPQCQLVQLGLIVDPEILFPPDYPYTSGTTRILRENFAQMYREVMDIYPLKQNDLVVDIGSNDGTLLSNFHNAGHRVHGVEPTERGVEAGEKGIKTTISFFNADAAQCVLDEDGPARIVTATNVFAHIENVHDIVRAIEMLLDDDGIFISESHYLVSLLETLQYDTIYHEHLRYYSLHSLQYLLQTHGLEVIHARRIPTHGGSIRVYAARAGIYPVQSSVGELLAQEQTTGIDAAALSLFTERVAQSKLNLYRMLCDIKACGYHVVGIGAPSRASTLVNYVGLDSQLLDAVLEIRGSHKIDKCMPGTLIPVLEEGYLFEHQPEYALLLSWHIADELIPKLREKGFRGQFIVPLPEPQIIS